MDTPQGDPWYRDGLAFECTRCGACCTGAPGYVWVDAPQIAGLAEFVGLPFDEFTRRYVRQVGESFSLIERPNGDCIFWERDTGCTVYSARPEQCRTWPFWPENIETPGDWGRVKEGCPGAGRGPVISLEEIVAAARKTAV